MTSLPSASTPQQNARAPWVYALWGGAAVFAVAALTAFFWWPPGSGAAAGGPDGAAGGGFGFGPAPVEVVEAVETIAVEPVQLLGSVSPVRQAIVASDVEGAVAEVLVDEGDTVRRGQLLASLRTTTVELDLAAARASRAEAAARLARFESELVRLTDLRDRRAISEREFEQGVADRDAQAQAVSRFEAEAALLEELIARARIVAPFSGEIAVVHVEVGEWIGRGGGIVTLLDLSEVEVTVPVPERYVTQAEAARRQGLEVPVRFDALPGTYRGKLKAVIPQANPQSRTFPVIIAIDNSDASIRGGMFARVEVQVGIAVPTVLVPKDALVLRSGRTFVYRVSGAESGAPATAGAGPPTTGAAPTESMPSAPGGAPAAGEASATVEEIEVTLGAGFGAWQAVSGGVAPGDMVVVRGNEMLAAGFPVMITGIAVVEPPPAAAADVPIAVRPGGRGR